MLIALQVNVACEQKTVRNMSENKNNMVLFFTNTPPEYRIPLYQELTSRYPVTFAFTRLDLAHKIYNNPLDKEKMDRIRFVRIPEGRDKYVTLKRLVTDEGVRCVIVPPLDSFIEALYGYWIYLWAKKSKKKTIYFWGKWEAPRNKQPLLKRIKNLFQRFVAKPIIKGVDYSIGYGIKACDYLIQNGADKERCYPAYYSSISPICKTSSWKEEHRIPKDRLCVLYFGRIIEKKGLRILIDAFSKLKDNIRDHIWLVIAGDGKDKPKLEEYAKELKVNNITWLGYVHPDNRYNYFSQCEVFVLPTFYFKGSVEAWGNTVNEALQCGCILIATEAVGSAYELINDKNGYMVKAEDSDSLANAISNAVTKKDLQAVRIEDKRIIETYNYKNSAANFIRIFDKCIAEGDSNE